MRGCSAVTVLPTREENSAPSKSRFTVHLERTPDAVVIRCFGRLCFRGEAKLLAKSAQEALEARGNVVLEFGGLEIIDSAGIGELVLFSMQAQALGCDVCIACASERVRRVLVLTNVASLFEFFDSIESALERCSSSAA